MFAADMQKHATYAFIMMWTTIIGNVKHNYYFILLFTVFWKSAKKKLI